MRSVAPWGLPSSLTAPIILVGGFMLAAARQSGSYNPWVDTISALAAPSAIHPWIMTTALCGLGVCHIATAAALPAAAPLGRFFLAFGGGATVGVAVFPTNATGMSTAHLVAASLAFGALAIWPALARRRREGHPPILHPRVSFTASAVLLLLVLWFVLELVNGSKRVGVAERSVAVAEALWPAAVVLYLLRKRAL